MQLTLGQIAKATEGIIRQGCTERVVARLCIDTRILQPGDVFVALKGRNFDGEKFVRQAIDLGASGIISAEATHTSSVTFPVFFLQVEDTTAALGRIAGLWRETVAPRVIAIAGSTGKTTTKEMLAHLCRGSHRMLATEGNKNNHIGLPLTLLRLEPGHELAIVELGMNRRYELAQLTRIARPDFALLTNIGDAHIGNFSGLDELIEAKAEFLEEMPPGATAFVSADCRNTRRMLSDRDLPLNLIRFGINPTADIEATDIEKARPFGYRFNMRGPDFCVPVYLPVFGQYQLANALGAASAALALGIPPQVVADRLAAFECPEMRSQVLELGGIKVVEDCYNASPSATIEAIRSFADFEAEARLFLLLGDMYELGDFSEESHRRVGEAAAASGIYLTVCVGEQSRWIVREISERHRCARHATTIREAVDILDGMLRPGDALLVKGSRAVQLEKAVGMLRDRRGPSVRLEEGRPIA